MCPLVSIEPSETSRSVMKHGICKEHQGLLFWVSLQPSNMFMVNVLYSVVKLVLKIVKINILEREWDWKEVSSGARPNVEGLRKPAPPTYIIPMALTFGGILG